MRWYAVMCKARKEELAVKNLMFQGYDTFYPHYCRWTTPKKTKPRLLKKPYLTRYIFCSLYKPGHSVYQINNTIGVSRVVYCGPQALEIPDEIIKEIKARGDDKGEIYLDEPDKDFPGRPGDWIKFVEAHPLFGFIAEIKRVDKGGRLMVEIEKILGAARELAISRTDVGGIISQDSLTTAP